MHRWQVPLRHFLERHLQNEHDAHDLAQETFVRIYQHRARWRDGSRFSTWMFQIGLNLTRDRVRWRSHRNHPPLDAARDTASDAPLPAATVELQERAEAVRVAIHALPDDLRATVILSEYEDRSHAEIADIMRTTPKAVETACIAPANSSANASPAGCPVKLEPMVGVERITFPHMALIFRNCILRLIGL